jgi:SAM-dependent methyltransferase
MNLIKEFQQRGPWVTRFEIDGTAVGGDYLAAHDRRLTQFFERFPRPTRVLELGSLEGGHSIEIARHAGRVVAIESRAENIERARFVSGFLGRDNIDFVLADLESFPLRALGSFDVIFNVGLLYHLPEPWRLVKDLGQIGSSMFLWTHTASPGARLVERGGYLGQVYQEGGVQDPLSGMSDTSFWPTSDDLERMLGDAGFTQIEIIEEDPAHPHGPAVTLACHHA